jgi:hypothetical protein
MVDARQASKLGGTRLATEAALLIITQMADPTRARMVKCGLAIRGLVVQLVAYLDTYKEL